MSKKLTFSFLFALNEYEQEKARKTNLNKKKIFIIYFVSFCGFLHIQRMLEIETSIISNWEIRKLFDVWMWNIQSIQLNCPTKRSSIVQQLSMIYFNCMSRDWHYKMKHIVYIDCYRQNNYKMMFNDGFINFSLILWLLF
jgi:hypothetical protein